MRNLRIFFMGGLLLSAKDNHTVFMRFWQLRNVTEKRALGSYDSEALLVRVEGFEPATY